MATNITEVNKQFITELKMKNNQLLHQYKLVTTKKKKLYGVIKYFLNLVKI